MIKLLDILQEIKIDTSVQNIDQIKKGQRYKIGITVGRLVMFLPHHPQPYIFKMDGVIGPQPFSKKTLEYFIKEKAIHRA